MSLFAELKRRNVFRVAAAYGVTGWLLIEAASVLLPTFEAPDWVMKVFATFVILGFPVAVVLAWAFEVTPEGIKRERDVDRSATIPPQTGRRLDRVIIVLLTIAVAYFLVERFIGDKDQGTATQSTRPALEKSIAVLPFANLSGNPDTDSFVAGLHDDLLTQLSKIHDLKVISRTSVLEYAGTTRKVRDIGRELGVATIMEGGVQRAGDRVRINVQLVATDSDQHLWAETYDRRLSVENIFDIQSEITRQIVAQLRAALTEGESAELDTRPTENLGAYEAYLDARFLLDQWGTGNFDLYAESLEAAEQATTLDPNFADAWAVLGWVHLHQFWYGGREPEIANAADRATARALQLNPDSALARATRGWYLYWVFFDYNAAIPEFQRAIELQPGSVSAWDGLASVYRRSGRWQEAIAAFEKTRELSPNTYLGFIELANTHRVLREFRLAEQILDLGTRRFPDSYPLALEEAGLHLALTGDRQPLLEALRHAAARESVAARARLDYVLAEGLSGDLDLALAYLDDWSPEKVDVQYDYWPEALIRAALHKLAGDAAQAPALAQQALRAVEGELQSEPDNVELEKARGVALALLERRDEAVASARRVRELYPLSLDAFGGLDYFEDAIIIASLAGDTELALQWLDEYQSGGIGATLISLSTDIALANIVNTPEFAKLVERYGLVPADRSEPR